MLSSNQKVFSDYASLKTAAELAVIGDFVAIGFDAKVRVIRAVKAKTVFAGKGRVVRVVTDKGGFELSADQRVRLSSGGYCVAGSLKPGMSLHAGSVDKPQGYFRVHLQNGKKGKQNFHRMAAEAAGLEITRMSVHHRDENKLNNRPENLAVMTQADHAFHHGRKTAATGRHTFQVQQFPHSGDKNGMSRNSPFWKNDGKTTSYRQKQGQILKSSGRASGMQSEAAKTKRCNGALRILNASHSIDTFEEYYAGFKAVIGPAGHSKAHIIAAIDKAFGSYAEFAKEVRRRNHCVLTVGEIGVADVYAVVVDSPNPGHPDDADGNFLIMSVDADSAVGSGIFVAGSPAGPSTAAVPEPTQNPPLSASNTTTISGVSTSANKA